MYECYTLGFTEKARALKFLGDFSNRAACREFPRLVIPLQRLCRGGGGCIASQRRLGKGGGAAGGARDADNAACRPSCHFAFRKSRQEKQAHPALDSYRAWLSGWGRGGRRRAFITRHPLAVGYHRGQTHPLCDEIGSQLGWLVWPRTRAHLNRHFETRYNSTIRRPAFLQLHTQMGI